MTPLRFAFKVTSSTPLDDFLISHHFGDRNIYTLIKEKHIYINNELVADRNILLNEEDLVEVTLNEEENDLFENDSPIEIIYEDEYILVVNKPYNLDVEPSRYTTTNNLASMVTHYFKKNDIHSKIHLVNRLDKLTTGLVIVAKNRYIKNLFKYTDIIKRYYALVEGITPENGTIINKLIKDKNSSKRIEDEDGKECKTEYRRIDIKDGNSSVDIRIYTGRTHQIRSSMKNINHPLVNDPLYNSSNTNGEMHLKAYYLKFIHPITNKLIELKI